MGLDVIYIQAKKWDTTVGRPEVQKFAGALQGRRARKGIFITTGSFSKDAVDFSSRIDSRIVLIDGKKLVDLMIDHNIGVSIVKTYERKKLDSDYFEEAAQVLEVFSLFILDVTMYCGSNKLRTAISESGLYTQCIA